MTIEIKLNGTTYHIEVESKSSFVPYKLGVNSRNGSDTKYAMYYCSKLSNAVHAIIVDSLAESRDIIPLQEFV